MIFRVAAAALALSPALALADPAMPDARLTPGAIASTDPAVVCTPGYARSQRLYSHDRAAYWALLREVMQRYRINLGDRRSFEFDHRIPLCAGGANNVENIWPQPLTEAREKDRIEWRVCEAVCRDHTMSLGAAQALFRGNFWTGANP